jgi:flagellar biosynthesis protein FlhB
MENPGAVPGSLTSGIIAIGAALITVLDVAWSRINFGRSVRMSREDIK